mmetsp:Transcript_4888/g.6707  ORF Transcript_4888/g.6707 Transcript_4888/m.6707 type:complete len:200 (-) Transcript_4888:351-950(-)|eukprot:CAMPEP_0185730706 /NCGR_PEP_ID=MMETSP1171-20130828/10743_1 /TAXON_ID=374046 /ORGANISM="Helicotheca tamensis, Strain CCMP826" /LENGTH=199 /DNA_ID=CAMNT_0028399817 /DNA_START=82 /DNA_END=681 /DNA_ORIENTATION=+
MGNIVGSSSNLPPLQTVAKCETAKFMGTWFVIGVKPTMFETTCSNAVEKYTRLESSSHDIDIDFTYNKEDPITSKLKSLPQKGWIQGENKEDSGTWKVSPFFPVKMPYPIIELDDESYDWVVIGYPSRQYCWIMSRTPTMADSLYDNLSKRLETKHQYDLDGLRKVPQVWTKAEREKRGLTEKDIPDNFLTDETKAEKK